VQEGFEADFPGNTWLVSNPDNDITWELTPTAFHSGTKCLRLRNYNNAMLNTTDAISTAPFDMTGMDTIFIDYSWAFARKDSATNDRLRISVTGTCGNFWTLKRQRTGINSSSSGLLTVPGNVTSMFTPSNASQWRSETLTLTDSVLMNDLFRVKFEFVGVGGNNIYLDDINIRASNGSGTSVKEWNDAYAFSLYPNPSDQGVQLVWTQRSTAPLTLELYSSSGQLCERQSKGELAPGTYTWSIAHQPAGMYFLVLRNGDKVSQRKVIFK
jgi:Secretion system C-terminal sorting domain